MNRLDIMTTKLLGKAKVLIMGRKSKREKRQLRKALARGNQASRLESKTTGNTTVYTVPKTNNSNVSTNHYNDWSHMISDHTHLPTMVCSVGDLNLWGATKENISLGDMKYIDLVVNCTQTPLTLSRTVPQITGNSEFLKLNKHIRKVNEVCLDWSDGSDLPVPLDFWLEFYDICVSKGFRNILFCCMGGHGRTGTGIGCLVLANSPYEFNMSEKIVDLVKERYCQNAVETLIQEHYLESLEREKKDRTESRAEVVLWLNYSPHLKKETRYTGYSSSNSNTNKGVGAKTLTQVIAEAQKAQENRSGGYQPDIFNGQGDTSAIALTHSEQAEQANKAIVLDMLTKEERAKKDSEAEQTKEALTAIEEYEAEHKELAKVKEDVSNDLEYQCFCSTNYECLSCEYIREQAGKGNQS